MFAHISSHHPFFYWNTVGASVVEWVSFFFLLNLGKTLSVLHTKTHTSPSLCFRSSSCFPVLAGNWSQTGFSFFLSFLPPILASRNLQTYWHTHTHTHTLLFAYVSALSHTRLAVDCVLTSFWTTDWGATIPTLLLGCCDCVLTLQCESRLTVRRNAFMVRCLFP